MNDQKNISDLTENVHIVNMKEQMEGNFIDYAMSVIMSRAIPRIEDGLKPVQRRILYCMLESGFTYDKKTNKSAKITGRISGDYHPHGTASIYAAMARMATDWNMRYPLIHGQGNFGSIDGDPPGAERYTEAKLSALGEFMLQDIRKNTVPMSVTYDGLNDEPEFLPAPVPMLLMNGMEGIAVGMATRIPPHNLGELAAAILAIIDNPDLTDEEILHYVKGPDFPTAGYLLGESGVRQYLLTGRGSFTLRGKANIEEDDRDRFRIIVTEIPYQVKKTDLIDTVVRLDKEKKITGISDISDESDSHGMRIVLELKRDANPQVILNQLYKHTQLQVNYSVIMITLTDGVPRQVNLRRYLVKFIDHRRVVITRRCQFELQKAKDRAHILEGLKIALDNLDEVIRIIKSSKDTPTASLALQGRFYLSEIQAKHILDMPLRQLTNLETKKILDELAELVALIKDLEDILAKPYRVDEIIKDELTESVKKFDNPRRTIILPGGAGEDFSEDDLVEPEDVVVTLTRNGYIKRVKLSAYLIRHRGSKGKQGQTTKADDDVTHIITTNTKDDLLCFTDRGQAFCIKVYRVPAYEPNAKGIPIVNLIQIDAQVKVTALLPLTDRNMKYLIMATKNGKIKRTELGEFSNLRVSGKRAIGLEENDILRFVVPSSGNKEVIIITKYGRAVRFDEEQVRPMGTGAAGVRGVNLTKPDDCVVGVDLVDDNSELLVISTKGYSKRSRVGGDGGYRKTNRNASGVITMKITNKTGLIAAALKANNNQELLIITTNGKMQRSKVSEFNVIGRNTQGVRAIKLDEKDQVASVEVVMTDRDDVDDVTEVKPDIFNPDLEK